MKAFSNKVIVKEIKPETVWLGYEDKDAAKLGKVCFSFEGEKIKLKAEDEVYYQYGTSVKIDKEDYILVSESNLICQK